MKTQTPAESPTHIGYSPVYQWEHTTPQAPTTPSKPFDPRNPHALLFTGLACGLATALASFLILDGMYGGADIRSLQSSLSQSQQQTLTAETTIQKAKQAIGCPTN